MQNVPKKWLVQGPLTYFCFERLRSGGEEWHDDAAAHSVSDAASPGEPRSECGLWWSEPETYQCGERGGPHQEATRRAPCSSAHSDRREKRKDERGPGKPKLGVPFHDSVSCLPVFPSFVKVPEGFGEKPSCLKVERGVGHD